MSTLSIVMIVFWAMEAIVLFCLVRSDRRVGLVLTILSSPASMAPAILTVGLFFTGIYNFFRYQYRLVPRENVRARRVDLALFGWAGPIGQVLYFAAFLDDNGRTGGGLDWWTALLLLVPAAVLYLVRRRTQTPRPKFRKPYDFFVPLFEVVYSFAFAMSMSFTILLLTIRPLFGCFLLLGCALSLYALIARYMRRAACPGFRTRGSFEHSNVAWYLSQMILATGIFVLSGNA